MDIQTSGLKRELSEQVRVVVTRYKVVRVVMTSPSLQERVMTQMRREMERLREQMGGAAPSARFQSEAE